MKTLRVRVVKDFTHGEGDEAQEFKVGMILTVDEATADEFVKAENCEVYDPEKEKAELAKQAEAQAALEASIKKSFLAVLDEKAPDGERKVNITVGGSPMEKDGMGGFASTAHFLSEVVRACKPGAATPKHLKAWTELQDAKIKAAKTTGISIVMEEGDDDQGGYLVPADIGALWMPPALETSISTSRAFRIPVRGNRIQMPALVDATHNGTYFGGVTIYRPGEGHEKTQSKPHLRMIKLTLHKQTVLVPVTDEMIEDSPISMAAFLNQIVPQAIAFQQDADHINGTGAGMALGAINAASPSLIVVPPEALQPAATIVYENIVNMWARFKMVNQATSCWVAGLDCFPQLATMAMAVGTGGVPVWQPANLAAGQPLSTLMGLPLILTEKTQLLGVQGDIGLIDWSQYYYADKGGLKANSSMHLWFDYDVTAFRFVLRSDGQPAWQVPLTPYNGGPTLSPFVVLGVRA